VQRLIGEAMVAARRLGFLHGIVPVIYTGLAYLALVGGLAVVSTIDAANITSVGAVMLVMLRSLSYGQGIQTSIASMHAALPFLDTLNTALQRYEVARLVDGGVPVGTVGRLTLDDVSFEYVRDAPVLRSVSFSIGQREVVGVVGPSGSGKSTLVQLLLALRTPTSGKVTADGRDVGAFSRAEWARKVTFVPQQAHLIDGTIADNVRFLRADVSDEQIEVACRHAHLHDDIIGFANGYRHEVGAQGSRLSGGQQQRLIIARALVEDPDVLILDEPTSALDVRSEHLIRETLDELRHRMTIIIIAHRLSTLNVCDRIMVIQDGELKAFDTAAALELSSDFYSEAVRLSGLR
jgi:ATP-binding cassette, subfamily B, bacterial